MKILGKEIRRLAKIDFELYLVDQFEETDKFVHLFEKEPFWKLKKHVYSDGELIDSYDKELIGNNCIEKHFRLKCANWFLKHTKKAIQLYVKYDYTEKIKVNNYYINCILQKYYDECRNMIVARREYAKEIGKVAAKLDLPFELVLNFKGDNEAIDTFIATVKKAISDCFFSDSQIMTKLVNRSHQVRVSALNYIGICVPEQYLMKSSRIGQYVYDCLTKRRIVGYFEK